MIKNSLIIANILMILVSSLSSRENPFEPTRTYIEEKKELKLALIKKEQDQNRSIKLASKRKLVEKPMEEIVFKEPIKQISKDSNLSKICIKTREIKTYKYHLLPFVNIHITNDIMYISTKYKLKKFFILEEENKLVFDYVGKKGFYTKRETLSSHKDFNKLIIGAHPENYYFRVVIQTNKDVSKYKVKLNKKRNKPITIWKNL